MREFKFRAWDEIDNKMYHFVEVITYKDGSLGVGIGEGFHDLHTPKKAIIMQYTGLPDKNKKDIYEGDICLSNGKVYRQIVWVESNFTWYAHNGQHHQVQFPIAHYAMHNFATLEVVGNIYENPELVNEKQLVNQ